MILQKISLNNFRNIDELELELTTPLTIFYGENGQGKTNIVESIYLLANATSFRTSFYKEMIQKDKEEAKVQGIINEEKRKCHYQMILNKNGKIPCINDILISKMSEYIGRTHVVCFSPNDVSLFNDSPGVRRHFLDKELSSLFPLYVKQLIIFKNVLEERNALLKENMNQLLLEVINDKLIESSYVIYKRRKWLIEKIEEFSTIIYKKLTGDNKVLKIVYHTFLDENNLENYVSKGKKIYQKNLVKDKEKLYTIAGIHKDDFKVYLDDLQIDMYASQGQQRLVSLCMKLAVVEIVSKASSEPIIILDDAFSELDAIKKEKLFDYVCNKKQVFITCTDYRNIVYKYNRPNITTIKIQNGKVLERNMI